MSGNPLYDFRRFMQKRYDTHILLRKYRVKSATFTIGISKESYHKHMHEFNKLARIADTIWLDDKRNIYWLKFYKETADCLAGYMLLAN